MLDKAATQLNKERWQEVARFEREEERQRSTLVRWRKLNALFIMATDLNLAIDANSQDEESVWNRWNKLRNLYLTKDVL